MAILAFETKRLRVASALTLAACLGFAPRALPSQAPPGGTVAPGRLSRVLEQVVDSLRLVHRVPGVAVAVVRDTQVLALHGSGFASLADSASVDPRKTVFRIGSVAKLFVATAVMQRARGGHLAVDAPLATVLPGFPLPERDGPELTLRHLLTHTGGFEERLVGYAARDTQQLEPLGEHLARRLPPRAWRAGERFAYSNYGVGLAAYAVERNSGIPFAQYAEDSVFVPLGMRTTRYRVPPMGSPLAVGYRCTDNAPCVPTAPVISHVYPVGLAFSTAGDMSRFMTGILGQLAGVSGSFVADAREMITAQPGVPSSPFGSGFGFLRGRFKAWPSVGHGGSVPGYSSSLVLVPDAGIGVFVTANATAPTFIGAVVDVVLDAALEEVGAAPPALDRPSSPIAGSEARTYPMSDLAGTYIVARRGMSSVERFPGIFIADKIDITVAGSVLRVRYPNGFVASMEAAPGDSLHDWFVDSTGTRRLLVGRANGERGRWVTTTTRALGVEVPASFERLSWRSTPSVLNEYISYLALIPLLLVFVVWPVIGLVRRFRGRRQAVAGGAGATRSFLLPYVVSALYVVMFTIFCCLFVARSNQQLRALGDIVYGMPAGLERWVLVPWVVGALMVVLVAMTVLSWRRRAGATTDRVILSLVTISACLGVAFLVEWRYLPMQW